MRKGVKILPIVITFKKQPINFSAALKLLNNMNALNSEIVASKINMV
jgi:hypothetical protein